MFSYTQEKDNKSVWTNAEEDTKENLLSQVLAVNQANLISVSPQIVFIRNSRTATFRGKITVENLTPRYVSYAVRSSDGTKFQIRDNYSYIPPYEKTDVVIITKEVENYREIAKTFFGVFAVPIYDKLQLIDGKLRILWSAHGTNLFPYEATEFHKISLVLPLSDDYFRELSILGRVHEFRISPNVHPAQLMKGTKKVDEETFYLHWPKQNLDQYEVDPSLELIINDWHRLSIKINAQTKSLIQSWKVMIGVAVTGILTLLSLSSYCLSDIFPFKSIASLQNDLNVEGN